MLINVNAPISLKIEKLTDLPKLRTFMEDNNLKINKSEIARRLNVDRRTVDKYLNGFEKSTHRNKPSYMSQYYDQISELLASPTQVFTFRNVLYKYMTENCGMKVPLPTFYRYLEDVPEFDEYFKKTKISKSSKKPVIRYETPPGEQAQFDWKESIPFVLSDTGEEITINVLVVVLGYSRLRIFKPALDMTRETLMHLLTEAFESLGGVPKELLTDNMKTVMDKARSSNNQGKVNSTFSEFAKDFGFNISACVAASPQTKGKVESQMKILEEIRAYSGKLDLVGLYELVERINRRENNRISQGTGRIPIMDFEQEKDSLLTLPHETVRNRYRIKTVSVKVNTASMINVNANQYSVPSCYIGEYVQYQLHDSNIYVYFNTKLIATHPISEKKLNYTMPHYKEILSSTYLKKDSETISQMAKRNLDIIGGIYSDE